MSWFTLEEFGAWWLRIDADEQRVVFVDSAQPASNLGRDRATLSFACSNSTEGIGVVLQAPSSGSRPGLAIMIDIPTSGDNSLWCGFGAFPNGNGEKAVWDQYKNQFKQVCYGQSSGNYRISMATNVLRGETPSPITGQKGYYYEYVVTVAEAS